MINGHPDTFTATLSEIDTRRREADSLASALAAAQTRINEQGAALEQLRSLRKEEKLSYQQSSSKAQARLLGTMRRLVYLAAQVAGKDAAHKKLEAYIHKLEQQLIQQHREGGEVNGGSQRSTPAKRAALPRRTDASVPRNTDASINRRADDVMPRRIDASCQCEPSVGVPTGVSITLTSRHSELQRVAARLRSSGAGAFPLHMSCVHVL